MYVEETNFNQEDFLGSRVMETSELLINKFVKLKRLTILEVGDFLICLKIHTLSPSNVIRLINLPSVNLLRNPINDGKYNGVLLIVNSKKVDLKGLRQPFPKFLFFNLYFCFEYPKTCLPQ